MFLAENMSDVALKADLLRVHREQTENYFNGVFKSNGRLNNDGTVSMWTGGLWCPEANKRSAPGGYSGLSGIYEFVNRYCDMTGYSGYRRDIVRNNGDVISKGFIDELLVTAGHDVEVSMEHAKLIKFDNATVRKIMDPIIELGLDSPSHAERCRRCYDPKNHGDEPHLGSPACLQCEMINARFDEKIKTYRPSGEWRGATLIDGIVW